MCNCGKKVTSLRSQLNTVHKNYSQKAEAPVPVQNNQIIMFKYIGNTALTVTGSITKKNYRFNFPGDIQPVDFIDASPMMAVPVLKKI